MPIVDKSLWLYLSAFSSLSSFAASEDLTKNEKAAAVPIATTNYILDRANSIAKINKSNPIAAEFLPAGSLTGLKMEPCGQVPQANGSVNSVDCTITIKIFADEATDCKELAVLYVPDILVVYGKDQSIKWQAKVIGVGRKLGIANAHKQFGLDSSVFTLQSLDTSKPAASLTLKDGNKAPPKLHSYRSKLAEVIDNAEKECGEPDPFIYNSGS